MLQVSEAWPFACLAGLSVMTVTRLHMLHIETKKSNLNLLHLKAAN
jgi:hypothetical protein